MCTKSKLFLYNKMNDTLQAFKDKIELSGAFTNIVQ